VYPPNGCFNRGGGPFGGAAADMGFAFTGDGGASNGPPSPLVVQDSIGPYDYAVLKADDKTAMLGWLNTNKYFVPTGTDNTVGAYIHPGAFFLALKLKSGKSTGDLQPVVVHYNSDLPMIPIVLTSNGATPDMGIEVWVLGAGRAIPRNYHHTVIDDAALDWLGGVSNYNEVVIRATHEADQRRTFVTEFAGSSKVMQGVLDYPGRFGNVQDFYAIADAGMYIARLRSTGYDF
jgi:hypothetical protein